MYPNNSKPQTQNKREEEWLEAIPEPYFHLIRLECNCGKKFWSRQRYEEHYAYKHILAL